MILRIAFISMAFVCSTANAYVYGGSNLGYSGYPDFSDFPPPVPYVDNEYMLNNYKMEAEDYVRKAKEYVTNGDNDIQRIKEAQQKAISDANQVVAEYNRKMRGY